MSLVTYKENSCGKFILVGEHAVVYGVSAVAIPLKNLPITASASLDLNKKKLSTPLNIKFCVHDEIIPDFVNNVILDAFKVLNTKPFDITIDIESNLPVGAGLGTSAALSVVVLRLVSKLCNIQLSQGELANYANILEKRFHGNPSGLDASVISYETIISFSKEHGATPLSVKEFNFALIDSNTRSSTKDMVKRAEPYFKGAKADNRLRAFQTITEECIRSLKTGDSINLANAMIDAKDLLDEAGLIGDDLHSIIRTCMNEGMLAAKPTGACGGGFIVALLDNNHYQEQLLKLNKIFKDSRIIHAFT